MLKCSLLFVYIWPTMDRGSVILFREGLSLSYVLITWVKKIWVRFVILQKFFNVKKMEWWKDHMQAGHLHWAKYPITGSTEHYKLKMSSIKHKVSRFFCPWKLKFMSKIVFGLLSLVDSEVCMKWKLGLKFCKLEFF